MDKQIVGWMDAEALGLGPGKWARAARVGNMVFLQGQTGIGLDGNLIGVGDPGAQARTACENIRTLMEQLGGSLDDVVKITVYITDRALRPAVYTEIARAFGSMCPCSTGLVVNGLALPELLVEIDAFAVIAAGTS